MLPRQAEEQYHKQQEGAVLPPASPDKDLIENLCHSTIAEMCQKIMGLLAKLMESGEIISKEEEALLLFFQILCDVSPDEKKAGCTPKGTQIGTAFQGIPLCLQPVC